MSVHKHGRRRRPGALRYDPLHNWHYAEPEGLE